MKLRPPEKRDCKRCGKEFTDDPANHPNSPHFKRRYCGYDCRTAQKGDNLRAYATKRRKPIPTITRNCIICKRQFTWQPKQHAARNLERKTCSQLCKADLRERNQTTRAQCPCGLVFTRHTNKKYCSKDCSKRFNPRSYLASDRRQKTYGLSPAEYDEMLKNQEGVCKICLQRETRKRLGKLLPLAVDHDHATGKVRGLLCSRCNTAIGLIHDNVIVALRLTQYLKQSNPSIKQQTLASHRLT